MVERDQVQGADDGFDLTLHWQSLTREMNRILFADGLTSPKVLGVRTSKSQNPMYTTGYVLGASSCVAEAVLGWEG